jgi:recombination protein RecA
MSALIKRKVSEIKEAVESPADSDLAFVTRNISVDSVVSTGSTLLDLAISGKRRRGGGMPGGIVVEMFGPAGSGKTALLAETCASAQLLGGEIKVLDPEARLDKEYARIYDMDITEGNYSRPDTVEDVFKEVLEWNPSDKSKINVIGTDSLAALSTELEMDKGDKMGMKRAKEFSAGFRKTARMISNNNWLMLCTNQIRQGDYGETTPGGLALAFYSSLRIRIKQNTPIMKEETISSGIKVKKIIGIESTCTIKKSTVDDPYREASIYILFGYGVDDIRGNLQYMKDMKNLNVYECPDGKTYKSLNMAIQYVEKSNLQNDLKEQTIDMWEEIESKFNLKRPKKQR